MSPADIALHYIILDAYNVTYRIMIRGFDACCFELITLVPSCTNFKNMNVVGVSHVYRWTPLFIYYYGDGTRLLIG
jgi:hypothetical protein